MKRALPIALALLLAGGAAAHAAGEPENGATAIAVLDFVNRSPGDGYDWMAKGLADMVITDLSASARLVVVDRERIQEIARELALGTAGLVDESTAPQVGKIANVQWVLFGTFLRQGDRLGMEAILINVTSPQALRIEQVEGPVAEVFRLERALIGSVLDKLDVPMTDHELRLVTRLKTQSLPAFEHYSRALGLFDSGQWHDALREARLACRADPEYLMAAARTAQFYYEVGDPEHALVEYRRLIELDRDDTLPDVVYYRMARILDEALADRAAAAVVFGRILERYREFDRPFRIDAPSQPSRGRDDVGGSDNVRAIAQRHRLHLRTLERLARWQSQAGNHFEAAQLYGGMRHFRYSHGLVFAGPVLGAGLPRLEAGKRAPRYWEMVADNRDATLYPPGSLHLISAGGETVGPDTEPTHGYYRWQGGPIWLAPPDHEIAQIEFSLGGKRPEAVWNIQDWKAQIDFSDPRGYQSLLFKILQVKADGTPHVLKLDPGIRAVKTYVHRTERWQLKFTLRPWSKPAASPDSGRIGGLDVNVLPEGAQLVVNGKSKGQVRQGLAMLRIPVGHYQLDARWPDGRRRSATVDLGEGERVGVLLNADLNTLSRKIVAASGSLPCLLTDRGGRIRLVWDQSTASSYSAQVNQESDLFCAMSEDGVQWSRPRRLPLSSFACDMNPLLVQDRRGVFWLVWISDRDPDAPRTLWIASSPNGLEWSFPRKIALPPTSESDLARWRTANYPRIAFTIDRRNRFWLIWQGWLLQSTDGTEWQVDSVLHTSDDKSGDNTRSSKCYHLSCDRDGKLLMVSDWQSRLRGATLWRRLATGRWEPLGALTGSPNPTYHIGGVASRDDGTILTVTPHGQPLFLRRFEPGGSEPEPVCVESHLTNPFHTTIAPLPDGRFAVAFGSEDGLVATVLQDDRAKGAGQESRNQGN